VVTGFVEFARSSQTVDGHSTLGDYNDGVVVCEVIQGQPSVRSRSLLFWPIKRTLYQGVATQDRLFPYCVPNSSIKHNKSDSKDRSQEIL
jgi:hypothetical protein